MLITHVKKWRPGDTCLTCLWPPSSQVTKVGSESSSGRLQSLSSSIHTVFHPGGDASVSDPPWAPCPVKGRVRLELAARWGVHPSPSRCMAGIRRASQPCLDGRPLLEEAEQREINERRPWEAGIQPALCFPRVVGGSQQLDGIKSKSHFIKHCLLCGGHCLQAPK